MKRKYVELWVAVDGTEFKTQEECDKYEREKGFMHKYNVEIHYSGVFYTDVEALSENEALHKAREEMHSNSLDFEEDESYVDLAD
jgi:hypothetical protein